MDHSSIREALPTLVKPFVPRNCRRITWRICDDKPAESVLGFRVDPKPFTGKVVAITEEAYIIQIARTEFAVVDKSLASQEPGVGARVEVTPYARRRFDGLRADTPKEETHRASDGQVFTVRVSKLGDATISLPVNPPRCPQLADLIQQLEGLPAPDGFRQIAHLLVDAGAREFSCVDPQDADILRTPPAISFDVTTAKFVGRVTIAYDRGSDTYIVQLDRDGQRIETVDEVYFDSLGQTLEQLIDDGLWRQIRIDIVSAKGVVRRH